MAPITGEVVVDIESSGTLGRVDGEENGNDCSTNWT